MDQVNNNEISLSSQIEVNYQDKSYIAHLKTFEGRVQISFTIQEDSHLKWQESYSVDQSYKINQFFILCPNLQKIFEYFEKLIKEKIKTIFVKENKMVVEFEIEDFLGQKTQFNIQLVQCQFDTNEVIARLSEQIINVKKQSIENKLELERIIQDQSIQIQQIKQQLTLLRNQFEEVSLKSNIIKESELEKIKLWVSNKQIALKPFYKATADGFQINKIFEACKDRKRVVLLIKTTLGKRFGFYSDLEIKSYGAYQAQNPNNIFIFSLDLKQKYTSNDSYCQHAFSSSHHYLAVGSGHDIYLYNNSNTNNNSYVSSSSYGKIQGLTGYTLNGGNERFQTTEVEIFEIKDI